MEKYIINKNTCAILPDINNSSTVIENYISYNVKKTPYEIIDESTKYYGSSIKGRIESCNYLLGIKYKCPIVVSEKNLIIMFPTSSYKSVNNLWINYNLISKFYYDENNNLLVEFLSGKKVYLTVSRYIFNSQFFKASRLDSIMKNKCRENVIN